MEKELPPRNYRIIESVKKQPIIYVVWIIMIIICMTAYYFFIGFHTKFTIIIGFVLFILLFSNMILSGIDPISDYSSEMELYQYVASVGQSFLPFGIALAALVIALSNKNYELGNRIDFFKQLLLASICFVISLSIVWVPRYTGDPVRIIRDIKTSILILGSVTMIVIISNFLTLH